MSRVISEDGTPIAYRRMGNGPAVILVGAGILDHSEYTPLAVELAGRFTVYFYDRRGRGDSGNTLPYAVEREIEDLDAIAAVARAENGGGPTHVFGISSGGALALEAAAAGVDIDRLAVYEVPYCVAGDTQQRWQVYVDQLWVALAEGRRGDAIACSMRFSGASETQIAAARRSPNWERMATIAHILSYEAASTGDGRPPTDRLEKITQPTLVATGGLRADARLGMSEMPPAFYDQAADVVAASIPNARRQVLEDQSHLPDPKAACFVLDWFFNDDVHWEDRRE
ncbi:probable hydrolase [Alloactinosynnema sp. L-07]|uniref:alpha/beta fold hydrolase n=1 Tax=Alloactinosynnema sp. L-07 TaxID=1653480 RepID=UPI00065EF44A|nr:alpha/beta hydrolase [Alloactinosynnema sp. L-07]CRK56735.1 probable hydrolase [Alloactinosynnema sp. L-07]